MDSCMYVCVCVCVSIKLKSTEVSNFSKIDNNIYYI